MLAELLPKFKTNMIAEAAKPKTQTPNDVKPEPSPSKWKGVLKTYKGDVPVAFYFNGTKPSSASLDTVRDIMLPKVEVHSNQYSYTVKGDLGLEDMGKAPYNMNFYLWQEGDELYGSAQTSSAIHPDTPTLSFWVEMKRVE